MELFTRILPLFLLIGLGISLTKLKIFPKDFMVSISKLVFYLALPALLIRAIASSDVENLIILPAINIAICLPIGFLLVVLASYLLFGKTPSAKRGTWIQTTTQANLAMMGLPVMLMLYGEDSLQQAGLMIALVIIAQNIFVVVEYLYYGERVAGKSSSVLMGFVRNPTIMSTFFAIILVLLGIHLSEVIDSTLKILAGMVLPLALLNIGDKITNWNFKNDVANLIIMAIFKLLIYPALALVTGLALGLEGVSLSVCVIALASPCATTSAIIAAEMGGDPENAATAISFTHALCPFTYSFWIFILHSWI